MNGNVRFDEFFKEEKKKLIASLELSAETAKASRLATAKWAEHRQRKTTMKERMQEVRSHKKSKQT
ncbi:hypothetical protein F442_11033 [Phytophthora nicotianae P10297]|uniref:Uncharacterized protein n=1 Tax=Phytophthora nicotianae P10297 TaxID=1317064 RepID=W2Z3S6_PHYNI|nr:hypothetical protein F442_11033 [Phytophthora nicotianae P10297]